MFSKILIFVLLLHQGNGHRVQILQASTDDTPQPEHNEACLGFDSVRVESKSYGTGSGVDTNTFPIAECVLMLHKE